METGDYTTLPPPIDFLSFGDPGFDQTLNMVVDYLHAIPKWWSSANYRFMPAFVAWMLYSLGHPTVPKLPEEPEKGAWKRVAKALKLELLILYPADYFGHLLATEQYGQWSSLKFYPTLQTCARLITASAASASYYLSGHQGPFCAFDPCIGTGRLCLEASNCCRALVGWDRDPLLLQIALLNFVLYAPDFAYSLPGLGGDLVRGDSITGEGTSTLRPELQYNQCPVSLPDSETAEKPEAAVKAVHKKAAAAAKPSVQEEQLSLFS